MTRAVTFTPGDLQAISVGFAYSSTTAPFDRIRYISY